MELLIVLYIFVIYDLFYVFSPTYDLLSWLITLYITLEDTCVNTILGTYSHGHI